MTLTVAMVAPYLIIAGCLLVVGTLAYAFVRSRQWKRSLLEALFFEVDYTLNLSPLTSLMFASGGILFGGIEVIWPGRHLSNWGWGFMSGGFFWTLLASIPIDRAKIMADVKKHQADVGVGDTSGAGSVPVTTTTTVGGPTLG